MTTAARDRVAILEGGKVAVGAEVDAVTRAAVEAHVKAWVAVRDDLTRAAAEAARIAQETGEARNPAAYRTARLQASLDALTTQMQRLGMATGVSVTDVAAPVMAVPQQVVADLNRAGVGSLNRAPARELEAIIRRQQEAIASRYLVLSTDAERSLRDALLRGVARGEGSEAVARGMVRDAQAATAQRLGIGSAAELNGAAASIVDEVRGAFAGGMQRALVLARTELIDASRVATTATYLANPDVVQGWSWMATLDDRTCPACWGMHGQVFAPDVHLEGHQQCVPAGTLVAGPPPSAATARPYQGRLLTVVTALGHRLAVTPNHPVLTARGWVAAGELVVGDEVVSSADSERVAAHVHPHDYQPVARVEDVAGPLAVALGVEAVGMPGAAEDFHGDGLAHQQVEVIRAARHAVAVGHPALQQAAQGDLVHAARLVGTGERGAGVGLLAARRASDSVMRGLRPRLPLLGRGLCHAHRHGLAPAALPDASPTQGADDSSPAHAEALRERLHRLAGLVRRDYVREVIVTDQWSGHVYNLQTEGGWYVADGIVVHNCRCVQSPWLVGEPPGVGLQDREEAFDAMPRGDQLAVLGPARMALREQGVPLEAMAQRRDNSGWRAGHYVTPVRDLL